MQALKLNTIGARRLAVPLLNFVLLASSVGTMQAGQKSSGQSYDVVILGGRVMDPESGLDAVRNVGIRNGKIAAITAAAIRGKNTVDAKGLVVSPGFIDLHAHGQDQENYHHDARDGVTTALELEIGVADIDKFYSEREGRSTVNFGATVGHVPLRMEMMHDPSLRRSIVPSGAATSQPATDEQIEELKRGIEKGLERGALGVGFGIQYVPAASRREILEMFRVAGQHKAVCFVHIRGMGLKEPNNSVQALEEVIAASAISGAPLHMVHVTSMGLRGTPVLLKMVEGARAHGLDVTTECYPYTAAMTDLASAIFNEGWQELMGIGYGELQWAATGERLNADTFAKYRQTGGMVIIHSIPEEMVKLALATPFVLVASDGEMKNGIGHPRTCGTFARVLAKYVREQKVLSLMEAIKKMSLMPAQRLERYAPMMKNKGRIKVGADADITVFDPNRVTDKATFQQPALDSEGIPYVLVNGVLVVKDGHLVDDVLPGRAVRAPVAR